MKKNLFFKEQDWEDDAYDRWRDEQMALKDAEEELIRQKYAFLDLPVDEFNKYCDEMVRK